jgi:hypothetical protein
MCIWDVVDGGRSYDDVTDPQALCNCVVEVTSHLFVSEEQLIGWTEDKRLAFEKATGLREDDGLMRIEDIDIERAFSAAHGTWNPSLRTSACGH